MFTQTSLFYFHFIFLSLYRLNPFLQIFDYNPAIEKENFLIWDTHRHTIRFLIQYSHCYLLFQRSPGHDLCIRVCLKRKKLKHRPPPPPAVQADMFLTGVLRHLQGQVNETACFDLFRIQTNSYTDVISQCLTYGNGLKLIRESNVDFFRAITVNCVTIEMEEIIK